MEEDLWKARCVFCNCRIGFGRQHLDFPEGCIKALGEKAERLDKKLEGLKNKLRKGKE